jgi:hypothetical protein
MCCNGNIQVFQTWELGSNPSICIKVIKIVSSEEAVTFKTETDKLIEKIRLEFCEDFKALIRKYGDILITIEAYDDLK